MLCKHFFFFFGKCTRHFKLILVIHHKEYNFIINLHPNMYISIQIQTLTIP